MSRPRPSIPPSWCPPSRRGSRQQGLSLITHWREKLGKRPPFYFSLFLFDLAEFP